MSQYWVDIDNPPQAQYLSPVAAELRRRGHDVIITARDHAATLAVLANRGETAVPVGRSPGASSVAKAAATLRRATTLAAIVHRRVGRPVGLVSTSRSGTLAGRLLRSRTFTILDYEGVELRVFRAAKTTILHPEVIPAEAFTDRGFPAGRLRSFAGLKEDLAFAGLTPETDGGMLLPQPRDPAIPAVLVRPPSETSHYKSDQTMNAMGRVLDRLSTDGRVQVVFSPREESQAEMLETRGWTVPPVLLEHPLPLVGLLAAVNLVVSGGGTMLREAAWMGVPAVSVFQGPMPAVDLWLEEQGAIVRVTPESELTTIDWTGADVPGIERRPEALTRVVDIIAGYD